MGAVSLVTFIAGAAGVGAFVAEGVFVWEKRSDVEFQRMEKKANNRKGVNFILRNPISALLERFAVPGNYSRSWSLRFPD
jgi:hypothetical protein